MGYATLDEWSRAKQEYDLALKFASKAGITAGIDDVQDAIIKRGYPALEKALGYLDTALSKVK